MSSMSNRMALVLILVGIAVVFTASFMAAWGMIPEAGRMTGIVLGCGVMGMGIVARQQNKQAKKQKN